MVELDLEDSMSDNLEDPEIAKKSGKRKSDGTVVSDKKRLKSKSLYRQPTVNELNRLQETENLFNSNLFRLQIEEVLNEVKVSDKTAKKFQEYFSSFKSYLLSIEEDGSEYDLSEQTLAKKLKVKLPLCSELKKTKCVFRFHKFDDVEIVGSYAFGCSINSKLEVNIQITVPGKTYTKNDSVNYRYHKKRGAYLAFIASHLSKSDLIDDIKYAFRNGCQANPVLIITPKGKVAKYLTVQLNLVCDPKAYKLHRFSPLRNNLREHWLLLSEVADNQSDVGPPTPYYNGSVLFDLTSKVNQEFLDEVLGKSENLKQAVVLLKIWIRQRKLQVSGHIISMFVSYLVQTKRINNIMSSYQIVRNVWISLKASELDVKGISLCRETEPTPSIEEFHQQFPVVFLDRTGYHNLCWQMSRGTYLALKRESTLAVEMLDNSKINSFIPLFMTPVQTLLQFDHILKFRNFNELMTAVAEKSSKEMRLNYGIDQLSLAVNHLHETLTKGLTTRVDLITDLVQADFVWDVKKTPEKAKSEGYTQSLSFGLILNSENSINLVDKGPQANLPEAEKFREFWGEKSELRRFQDGSITEACVWQGDTISERRTIVQQIIDYLMQFKYAIPSTFLFHISSQLDSLLTRKQYRSEQLLMLEESSVLSLRGFDDLRRDVRALTDLPLDVSAVYGISPVLSYCSPLPPLPVLPSPSPSLPRRGAAPLIQYKGKPNDVPQYTPVVRAVLELGHSGKWPGELQAFRCLKAAFHLQISDQLHKQFSLPTQAYPTHIDVMKNGLVYRLEIAHPKEITLVRKEIEGGVVKMKENDESIKLQRDTVLLPRLRGALHGLHQKFPAFGPTACLVQRWISAHLLSNHFPDIVSQLLTAYIFLIPAPYKQTNRVVAGFVRVLKMLAEKDWTSEILMLDFNDDLTREEISTIERSLTDRPPLTIVTSHDGPLRSVWTRDHPTQHVLQRVKQLASTTIRYIETQLMDGMEDNILGAFISSYSGYDVIIHLRSTIVPYCNERVDSSPKLKRISTEVDSETMPVVEFNAVEKYVEELTNAYKDFALFFYDKYGGEVIAVLWKPDINEPREFQVATVPALKPVTVDGETIYKVNKEALVEDFRILGEGLVNDITVT